MYVPQDEIVVVLVELGVIVTLAVVLTAEQPPAAAIVYVTV